MPARRRSADSCSVVWAVANAERAAGRSSVVRPVGQGCRPRQQLGPGRAEGLGGKRRGAQCGQSSVRRMEVGPTLLGGRRQTGALVLGVLQCGASGVAGGGRRPFLLGRPPRSGPRGRSTPPDPALGSRSEPAGCPGRSPSSARSRSASRSAAPATWVSRAVRAVRSPRAAPRPPRAAARHRAGRHGRRPGRARPAGRAASSRSGRRPGRRGRPADAVAGRRPPTHCGRSRPPLRPGGVPPSPRPDAASAAAFCSAAECSRPEGGELSERRSRTPPPCGAGR